MGGWGGIDGLASMFTHHENVICLVKRILFRDKLSTCVNAVVL
jgi:hypothetical protein